MPTPPFTLINSPLVGLEDLQRAAFYVFLEGLNNALEEIANYWLPRDEIYDQRTNSQLSLVSTLEEVPVSNFHEGHKPSLLTGTPENYPCLSVFGMTVVPAPNSAAQDVIDSWISNLLVEIMVKAPAPTPSDDSGEVICNRRVQRMAEAVVMCVRRNPDLGGAIYGLAEQPSIAISDLFAVRSTSQGGAYQNEPGQGGIRSGSRYVWQGASINFRIQTDSAPPSSGAGTFAQASQVDYTKYIDQG